MKSLRWFNRKVTDGWQLVNVSTISSGPPFTVYSGIQQTGAGSSNADRPDQISAPSLSLRLAKGVKITLAEAIAMLPFSRSPLTFRVERAQTKVALVLSVVTPSAGPPFTTSTYRL